MTSSILPPRSVLAPCSPITQARASTTLDLPEPLGPTTAVMPGSKRRVVADAKDLKPFSVRLLRYTTRQTTAQSARLLVAPLPGVASSPSRARSPLNCPRLPLGEPADRLDRLRPVGDDVVDAARCGAASSSPASSRRPRAAPARPPARGRRPGWPHSRSGPAPMPGTGSTSGNRRPGPAVHPGGEPHVGFEDSTQALGFDTATLK